MLEHDLFGRIGPLLASLDTFGELTALTSTLQAIMQMVALAEVDNRWADRAAAWLTDRLTGTSAG